VTLANDGIGFDAIGSLLFLLIFIVSYVRYGNRLRASAGRSVMMMALGCGGLLVSQILRHPFGVTTNSTWFVWLQIGLIALGGVGTVSMLWLMIRANGYWPWQKGPHGKADE
jgi:hypothetical protein